jgi:DNA polymerase-1
MWAKISPQGKIHPTLKLAATATGRLAGEDPNPQNIPRDPRIRGQFVPRSGYAILEVDYSQAELRCLALLSRCPDLCAIFDAGKDLHVEVSIELFGPQFTHEDKMAAKTVNFGIVYGRTAPSIANDPVLNKHRNISVEEAQSWIDGWAKRFPGAWNYIQECRMAPVRNQTMVTVFGNKKRPGVVSRERLFGLQNEAANFPHQNIASNINLHAAIKLFDPLRTVYDTHIINLVHDCIVTETPFGVFQDPTRAQEHVITTAKFMASIMEAEAPLWGLKRIPFKVEPEFGFRWGNVLKFKDIARDYGGNFNAVPDQIAAH